MPFLGMIRLSSGFIIKAVIRFAYLKLDKFFFVWTEIFSAVIFASIKL